MLQHFLVFFITFIILLIAIIIITIILPMWRFMESADNVIHLFSLLKILLKFDDLPQKGEIKISYGKCKLKFGNVNEASIELEKLAKEALEYYDKLGWIAMTDNYFQANQYMLRTTKVKVGKSRSLKTNVGEYPTFSLWLYVNRIRNL